MSTDMEIAFTGEALVQDIRSLGVAKGDIVYVHSSLKSVGPIEGGADTLLASFLTALGEDGTLAVPTHSLNYVNLRAEPFDLANTPSFVGAFTELVRKHPKAFRSLQPTHSSAAIGKQAEWLTANHDLANPCGYESPLGRIYRENGKILLLGVGHKSNTILHFAESLFGAAYTKLHYDENWGSTSHYIDANGTVQFAESTDFPGCSSGFAKFEALCKEKRISHYGTIGNAPCQLMHAKDLVDEALAQMRKAPDFLLCENERCPRCMQRRKLILS